MPDLSPESSALLRSLYERGWRYSFHELADGRVRCALLRGGLEYGTQGEGTTGGEAVRQAYQRARTTEGRRTRGALRSRR